MKINNKPATRQEIWAWIQKHLSELAKQMIDNPGSMTPVRMKND